MSLLWRKAIGDARARALQLATMAAILVLGTAATIAATDARIILGREIAISFEHSRSPDLVLYMDRVTPEAMAEVAGFEGVEAVDARRVIVARVAARTGEWLPVRITVLKDPASQAVGRIHQDSAPETLDSGRDGLWLEQSGRSLVPIGAGPLTVRTPNGATVEMPIAGLVHDPAVAPSTQERMLYGFATPASVARLNETGDADQLWVRLNGRAATNYARDAGEWMRERLAERGMNVLRVEPRAAAHPHALLMSALLRVLTVLSTMSLACTGALAAYLTSSWIRREGRVVGILRTLGARGHHVAFAFLPLMGVLLLGVALVGVYLGGALARAIVRVNASALNIDVTDWVARGPALDWAVGGLVTVAVLGVGWPILKACATPVREALADPGIVPPSAGQRLGRFIRSPRSVIRTYALRNALRRPWRLALITLALALGGALFLGSGSNYESLIGAIDCGLAAQGHDIEVVLAQPTPARADAVARSVSGVAIAETWRRAAVRVRTAASPPQLLETSDALILNGYPTGTHLFTLPIAAGRPPAPTARDEIVVTRMIEDLRPDVRLGSVLELEFGGRRTPVRVVGVVNQIGTPALYAPEAVFEAITAQTAANALRIKATGSDLVAVGDALDRALADAGIPAAQVISRTQVRDALDEHFSVVGTVLRMAAVAAAVLGALILVGGASFDVLERRREIGVLRSLGAPRGAIARAFLTEGSVSLALSMLLAIGLALALTSLANGAAARTLLHVPVPLRFSASGCLALFTGVLAAVVALRIAVGMAFRESITDSTRLER